ncbi:hypothetical protein FACS189418_7660 [Clostridia bacterium]|nr:hypothetical protein FACS189418_7660 [Clostridia bacterium]
MRKSNSKFKTEFLSEEGNRLLNKDYFAYVELDKLACYVMASSLDEDRDQSSAEIAVTTIIRSFTESPSISENAIRHYIYEAHRALGEMKEGMQLKATLAVVFSDYRKIRYAAIGNTRFALVRNDRIILKSSDQSLTENLIQDELVEKDKISLHEERNNLYSYLGMKDEKLDIFISPLRLLDNGDIWMLFTRGFWEYCDEGELMDSVVDAKEPIDIINNSEELILSKQPELLDNYSIAVTFVNKVYQKPKRRVSLKRILLVAIPLIILLTILIVTLLVMRSQKVKRTKDMNAYIESAEKYINYDNYIKAADEVTEALNLANKVKNQKKITELDQMKKLLEQILLADDALQNRDYAKADEAYRAALKMSEESGNVAKTYIEGQILKNGNYKEVYDLIDKGDMMLGLGDTNGARSYYLEAKALATKIFYQEGKQEATDKITVLDSKEAEEKKEQKEEEEKKEESKAKEEEKNQQQQKDEEDALKKASEEASKKESSKQAQKEKEEQERLSAIEIERQGNTYYEKGDYENALLYYYTAREMYTTLKMQSNLTSIEQKIALTEGKINSTQEQADKAALYVETGNSLVEKGQYHEALILYELALDFYKQQGNIQAISSLQNKIEALKGLINNQQQTVRSPR